MRMDEAVALARWVIADVQREARERGMGELSVREAAALLNEALEHVIDQAREAAQRN